MLSQSLFCPSQQHIFSGPEHSPADLIDHIFVSIHTGQIHHSNLSSTQSAGLIMWRETRKKKNGGGQPPV